MAEHPLCDDLYRSVCTPETRDDGTGISKAPGLEIEDLNTQLEELTESNKEKFLKNLEKESNSYFRERALLAAGLKFSSMCLEPETQKKCNEELAKSLSAMITSTLQFSIINGGMNANGYGMGMGTGHNGGNEFSQQVRELLAIQQMPQYTSILEKSKKKIEKGSTQTALIKNIKDNIFPEVRRLMIKRISKMDIPQTQKTAVMNKLKTVAWGDVHCNQPSSNSNLANLFYNNAQYDSTKHAFSICNGMLLNNTSHFNLVTVIAHELSHSIDPCNIAKGPESFSIRYKEQSKIEDYDSQYPFATILKCLRTKESVGAQHKGIETIIAEAEANANANPYNNMLPEHSEKPKVHEKAISKSYRRSYFWNPYCMDNDQASEAIGDWFGIEILSDYLNSHFPNLTPLQHRLGYSNILRVGCTTTSDNYPSEKSFNEHPETESRINGLILKNPKVREKMGCIKKDVIGYCTNKPKQKNKERSNSRNSKGET